MALLSCKSTRNISLDKNNTIVFDKQGHRGTRGLMPENTIPAMIKAIDLGVTTLEVDVVITKDNKVLISHDHYFHQDITTKPDGSVVTAAEAKSLNIYKMTYEETKAFDVGLKPHPGFPQQQKMRATKPLLADLIDSVETYIKNTGKPAVRYNIEVKSNPLTDGIYHPAPEKFVDMVMEVIKQKGIEKKINIQSFDFRNVQYVHKKYPSIETAILIEGADKKSLDEQITKLGFVPDKYSPHFSLVTPGLVEACHAKGVKLIPWTVNRKEDIERLKAMGVDGIITDYPNLFNE